MGMANGRGTGIGRGKGMGIGTPAKAAVKATASPAAIAQILQWLSFGAKARRLALAGSVPRGCGACGFSPCASPADGTFPTSPSPRESRS